MAQKPINWRYGQWFAAGHALIYGRDVAHRIDLILLAKKEQETRAVKLVEDAIAAGFRPALAVLEHEALKGVRWPPGIPVYLVPPDDPQEAEKMKREAVVILGAFKLPLLWARPDAEGDRGSIGFASP